MKLPDAVRGYLSEWVAKERALGYLLLDHEGRIASWGGALDRLGIGPLQKGDPGSDHLIFLEGLLPTHEPALHLPMVKLNSAHTLDVHLFRIETGYGVLLLDAGQKLQVMTGHQQQVNDLALLREARASVQPRLFNDLFYACNMAALKMGVDGRFVLLGRAPDWLSHFCPEAESKICDLDPENVFSFLNNFLHEAHQFWRTGRVGCIKSGMWIEVDQMGREHLFEATALNTGPDKVLLIADEHSNLSEKQSLIQKGRNLALGHCNLEKTQADLQSAHDDLEERVKARTLELEQANQRLASELNQREQLEKERTEILLQLQQSQKMEAIGTLAGGIAHDFNNILSAVIGFTELSLMRVEEDSPLKSDLKQVFAAGLRAKDLIRQILTFSRQSNPETRPVQVVTIIKEALKLLRASLPASIEIQQELSSKGYVMADPTQLHQVVMNLCTNAGQAMQAEGGALRISLNDLVIGEQALSEHPNLLPGDYLELVVVDSGHGMTREVMERIYEPFFTTKSKHHGTGMGLSVVHGIVKNCKGDVYVSSTPDAGTTFRVLLPTVKSQDTFEMTDAARLARGSEHILFVDDEPMQVDLAVKTLTPLGYRVEAFTDSAAALKRFTQAPDEIDLVITDMYMPKMTGKTLAAKIHGIRPQTPIVLCSGYADGMTEAPSADVNISGYLKKPFGMMEMTREIRKVLDSIS